MTYKVVFKPSVNKEWRRIPASIRRRIEHVLRWLSNEPTPPGCRLLHGYNHCYRIRVGDYRIIYELETNVRIVRTMRIRDRKDAYKGL